MIKSDLTIVTVVKDYSEGLDRTIRSVRAQNIDHSFNIFHIFCDGGSQPGEFARIRELIGDETRIISRKDSGIYAGMNKGLEIIESGWVLFLNAGDTFSTPDSLGSIIRILDESKSGFLQFKCTYDDGLDRPLRPYSWFSLYAGFSMHAHPALFFKRELFKDIFFDESFRIAADLKFVLQAMKIRELEFSSHSVSHFESSGISSTEIEMMINEMNRVRLELKPVWLPKAILSLWNSWTASRNRYLRRKSNFIK